MNLIDATLTGSIESAINAYLSTRPSARNTLNKLAGQSLGITLLPQELRITLIFSDDQVSVMREYDAEPTTHLTGSASDLLKLLNDPNSVMFGQGVEVKGDSALLQRLSHAFDNPTLDWEDWLAEQIGDLPAAMIMKPINQSLEWANSSRQTLTTTAKEYLQEEINLLPTRVEFEGFIDDARQLKQKAELLERRLKALLKDS
ncbi:MULTISPECIES: SCP2 domain-containing protein [unclassified Marinobacterium]|uniref:ubiquinone biosynthesis accessory factor UbiJ n=1 Tax=unclassified Marinobacterium TaxID=2644139 RepID=UPI001567F368|nr:MULTISPECIES: SCP2 sterol-binding domain-containing protein [unclassified Marinobacterium]NRP15134.1 SCP-2 sterol transfer family protein [Marinobacterium sp. xm-a-152]NRP39465.1 SCP-2 sterol transfer family protein [Marinobacterium sp. xm-a-121]NRP47631.1 SCP-2 sterol transfer family protein [Marinobacterium sp. xm-d-543]NRP53438.1 SCP-2 sterol transfer family protein [Marinobacterium sp. xm-v-242]NRP77688.1 SCP-2 sterol transfer family protein [Marinobacterium sp. xm-m-383]